MSYLQLPKYPSLSRLSRIGDVAAFTFGWLLGHTIRFTLLGCLLAFLLGFGMPILAWFHYVGVLTGFAVGSY